MSFSLSSWFDARFFKTGNNAPLTGGKIYTYLAGTTTPVATYSNDSGTTNTNPIILDADGRANIYLDDSVAYRFILKDANNVTQKDVDNIRSSRVDIVQKAATIADLRLLIGTSANSNAVVTLGYYVAGDGGGNTFYWDALSGATDNGGAIIKPTAIVGAGRWIALDSKNVTVKQFGAKGVGNSFDDSDYINNTAVYCRNNNAKLIFGACNSYYYITKNIDLTNILLIDCDYDIKSNDGAYSAITIGGTSTTFKNANISIKVSNLADKSIANGNIGIKIYSLNNSRLSIYARGYNEGVVFDGESANRVYVQNEISVSKLYNNGSHVVFAMAGTSYAVKSQFIGGSYYIGTNQKIAGRGTFVLRMSEASLVSDVLVMSPEIGVSGGSYDADQAVICYATIDTTNATNTIEFSDVRYEGYSTFSTDPLAVKITNTSGRLGVDVSFGGQVSSTKLGVSVPQNYFNRVRISNKGIRPQGNYVLPQLVYPKSVTPYQANGRCYVPDRVLFETDYTSPVDYFSGFSSNSSNRAIGDGDCVCSSTDKTYGFIYSKNIGQVCFLELLDSDNYFFVVICYDTNGNVISGSSPFYAVGGGFRTNTKGIGIYEFNGRWLWLHKDVASFYIGQSAWGNPSVLRDVNFNVIFGSAVFPLNTLRKSNFNYLSNSSQPQSYFKVGMQLDGTSSNGWRNTFYLQTSLSVAANVGDPSITVSNATGVTIGDTIGVELDTVITGTYKRYFNVTVSNVVGNVITLSSVIPSGANIGNRVYLNRWVAK